MAAKVEFYPMSLRLTMRGEGNKRSSILILISLATLVPQARSLRSFQVPSWALYVLRAKLMLECVPAS
jgi:hypothetical protein